ncbi:MAG: NAD-dependent epimerase/dehydratase family protein, partial [Coleofasciculaceae cyanobacterium SM2_3_26]|nr:NAD-dependent epimerase/dehydratase family protein [Coleofasciculaceae cyanobacterium SM2_3_26]
MTISIVTGVAGFIGSHLAEALLKQGQQVLGVDEVNDYYDPSFKHRNLEELKPYSNFQFIQADMASLGLAG